MLGDYPTTAGTESICRAPNLLRCDVLKNKCWLNLQGASAKKGREGKKNIPPLGCVLKADSVYLDIKAMEEDASNLATTL